VDDVACDIFSAVDFRTIERRNKLSFILNNSNVKTRQMVPVPSFRSSRW